MESETRGRRKSENRRIRRARGRKASRGGRCERREETKIESGGFVVSFRVSREEFAVKKGIQRFDPNDIPLPPISAGEQNEGSREISRSH